MDKDEGTPDNSDRGFLSNRWVRRGVVWSGKKDSRKTVQKDNEAKFWKELLRGFGGGGGGQVGGWVETSVVLGWDGKVGKPVVLFKTPVVTVMVEGGALV